MFVTVREHLYFLYDKTIEKFYVLKIKLKYFISLTWNLLVHDRGRGPLHFINMDADGNVGLQAAFLAVPMSSIGIYMLMHSRVKMSCADSKSKQKLTKIQLLIWMCDFKADGIVHQTGIFRNRF